ncbi:Putative NmrA-like domain, NAD(P)-binding domain superfamily [Colletotrichum destructivum]|uniref:NmrA-like domain, NAD(P)-binding domain superfamily n=1 Tax=Colletotrichum destructivum TaxID=34406 RepID=A0AAX4I255_9PEZI|nr:Putative NmrA-like domain, NAD(P)-binding domain superfamily [Colletotrichum destructivum]
MTSKVINVAIFGATGESAGAILDGLLESTNPRFEVTALARLSTTSKPAYQKLALKGVKVVAVDFEGPVTEVSKALEGHDIVVASVPPTAVEAQLVLVHAAKLAGIKRFVPSAFAMAIAPSGVSSKDKIYAELFAIGLSFTIIDVGWWYNGFVPKLPSGRTDYMMVLPEFMCNLIPGNGDTKTHVVAYNDIGRLVARIIADPKTINKKILASGAVMSFNEMFDIAEELSREKTKRKYAPAEHLRSMINHFDTQLTLSPEDRTLHMGKICMEYYYSSFVDGDNSPDGVARLGYVLATELYHDFQPTTFRQFFQDVLESKARVPYSDRQ